MGVPTPPSRPVHPPLGTSAWQVQSPYTVSTRLEKPASARRKVQKHEAYSDTVVSTTTASKLIRKAQRYENRGEPLSALAIYKKIAEQDELAAHALTHCARIQRDLNRLDDAVRSLTVALHHCVGDHALSFEIHTELGDVFAELADYEEAAYYYRRALGFDGGSEQVKRRLRVAHRMRYQGRRSA